MEELNISEEDSRYWNGILSFVHASGVAFQTAQEQEYELFDEHESVILELDIDIWLN